MGMQITDLVNALHPATERPEHNSTVPVAVVSHLHALAQITTYLTELPALLAADDDPRAAALIALSTEHLANQLLRNQLHATHRVETTAAHTLPVTVLDELKPPTPTRSQCAGGDDRERLNNLLNSPCEPGTGRPTYRDAASFLASWLNLEYFAAETRVNDAHRLIARPTGTEELAPPLFTELAEQFTTGLDPRGVISAARRLEKATTHTTTGSASADASIAPQLSPTELETQAATLLNDESPRTRNERLNRLFRQANKTRKATDPLSTTGLFRKGTTNGITTYLFKAAAEDSELIESVITHVDHPKTQAHAEAVETAKTTAAGASISRQPATSNYESALCADTPSAGVSFPDFLTPEEAATARADELEAPEPTIAQRRLAGLINLLRAQSNASATRGQGTAVAGTGDGEGKPKGLFRPTVIVHMPLRELVSLAETHGIDLPQSPGVGTLPATGGITAHGLAVDSGALRRMLCEANIIPLVLGGASEILDVGRSQRYFPTAMKRAILARDRGCIVPGCTVPAENCEIDHVFEWEHGGPTSVDNGATLHPGHHVDRHAGLFEIVMKDGIPWVRYPKHVDPEQRLRRNTINFTPK